MLNDQRVVKMPHCQARCASGDAVRVQAKATGAEAARRRLQAPPDFWGV